MPFYIDNVNDPDHLVGHKNIGGDPFDEYNRRRYYCRFDISGYTGGNQTLYAESSDNEIRRQDFVLEGEVPISTP